MLPLELEERRLPAQAAVGYSRSRASVLLVAECVGTGVLALPGCAAMVGSLGFVAILFSNVALQIYAGSLLTWAAEAAERKATYAACEALHVGSALHVDRLEDEDEELDGGGGGESPPPLATMPRDFVELSALVGAPTRGIACCWYLNLVLVLGQYLVVMARALRLAVDLGGGCDVLASLLASCAVLLVLAQLPTLEAIGRGAAQVSLASVVAILGLAVAATPAEAPRPLPSRTATPLRAFAAASALTFAMSTTKLFLNVRLEMTRPADARGALFRGVAAFSVLYLVVALGTGRDPPPFILDALSGAPRRAAAALLFSHVAVSFAINQQVLAKTVERALDRGALVGLRWTLLTGALTALALLVAVALPVFSDLVALIGALTSGPLTFAIPAILFRAATRDQRDQPQHRAGVFCLLAATAALVCLGTAGVLRDVVGHARARRGPARYFCTDG